MSLRWKLGFKKKAEMFTGIVEELGAVVHPAPRLVVECALVLEDLRPGASIAVNGVCLTAVAISKTSFAADLAPETLRRSNLGELATGARVNLERPVTPTTRLSGHIVQGHVDATGVLLSLDPLGDGNYWLKVQVPEDLDRYLVQKGSLTIDGISLTIAQIDPGTVVGVTIIPHTYGNTSLGSARPGSKLNLEVDVIAKHIEKLLNAAS
jgi:riboflavin synthase